MDRALNSLSSKLYRISRGLVQLNSVAETWVTRQCEIEIKEFKA